MKKSKHSMEVKPVTTRKLRRRPNDPLPVPEKRRKTLPNILSSFSFSLNTKKVVCRLISSVLAVASLYALT
ncbi:UNVERIFIED_CONTAM: Sin3 histone deacetylase corepressor complex component SDS3 [Trichonephila clavipes]